MPICSLEILDSSLAKPVLLPAQDYSDRSRVAASKRYESRGMHTLGTNTQRFGFSAFVRCVIIQKWQHGLYKECRIATVKKGLNAVEQYNTKAVGCSEIK